jgi:effector-binding domain-containing protein
LFFDGDANNPESLASGKLKLKAGFPVRGNPSSKARYKSTQFGEFKCTYLAFKGDKKGLEQAWRKLYQDTLNSGYELSGSSRQILKKSNNPEQLNTELQLGVL